MNLDWRNYAIAACIILLVVIFVVKQSEPSPAQTAEQQYAIVDNAPNATSHDRCLASGKVAQAWLAEGNEEKYRFWKMIRDSSCLGASS